MPNDRGATKARTAFPDVASFVRGLAFADLPPDVALQATRCLLDLTGVGAAGTRRRASGIARSYTASQLCGRDEAARMLFDGRRAGIAGAAFAGAATIDAIDGHDGHVLTKGHAGVAILPALLALCDGANRKHAFDGREFLTCLVLGYEIATRAAWPSTPPRRNTIAPVPGTRSDAPRLRRGSCPLTRRGSGRRWASPNTSVHADRYCVRATHPAW